MQAPTRWPARSSNHRKEQGVDAEGVSTTAHASLQMKPPGSLVSLGCLLLCLLVCLML